MNPLSQNSELEKHGEFNVLIVSLLFPPSLTSESIQVWHYVRHLQKHGWIPQVLTVDPNTISQPIDNELIEMVPSSIKIWRAPSLESNIWVKRIWNRARLKKVMPEYQVLWFWAAQKLGSKILRSEKRFNLIYSRACPFTSNLVGLYLKKKTRLPWIAHFSDPWVDSPYFPNFGYLHRKISQKLEKLIIYNADGVTFASEYIKKIFVDKYPMLAERSYVVPNCYDLSIMPNNAGENRKPHKFTITYTGQFYGIRTPVPLLRAIELIMEQSPHIGNMMRILIVGWLSTEYRNMISNMGLDKIVSVVEAVPYRECLKYMAESDALLLVDAPSQGPSIFLPSKLIEYISTYKPVLGITNLEGASADLIRSANGLIVAPDDIRGIAEAICQLYEKYKNGSSNVAPREPLIIQSYDARNTSEHLAEVFMRVIKQHSKTVI